MLHFPIVLTNRLNKIESSVIKYCRLSLFVKDPVFYVIKMLPKINHTSETKCLVVFHGQLIALKWLVRMLCLPKNLLGKADFVFLAEAQIIQ